MVSVSQSDFALGIENGCGFWGVFGRQVGGYAYSIMFVLLQVVVDSVICLFCLFSVHLLLLAGFWLD